MRLDGIFKAEDSLDAGRDPALSEQVEQRREIMLEPVRMLGPLRGDVVEGDAPRCARPSGHPLDAQEIGCEAEPCQDAWLGAAGLMGASECGAEAQRDQAPPWCEARREG